MSYNLSKQFVLNGLGNTPSKEKFDMAKFSIGRAVNEIRAMEKFEKLIKSTNKTPLYTDIIKDPELIMSIIHREIPFVMTDKYRNIHIMGYMDDDMQPHTHFKNLWESGALFKGNDKSVIVNNNQQMWYRDRDTDNGWQNRTAYKIVNDGNMFFDLMKNNEKKGYNPIPYFYIFKDVKTYDLWDVTKLVANAVMAVGSTFIPVLGGVVGKGISQLIKIGDKFAKGEISSLGFEEWRTIIVDGFAPLVGLDVEFNKLTKSMGDTESYIKTIQEISEKAYSSYRAVQQFESNPMGAIQELGKTLEIDGVKTLNYLQKDLKLGNIIDVAKAIKKPIEQAEKLVNQMTNSEVVNSLMTKWKQYDLKATVNGALEQLPTQQFILDIQAGLKGGIEELTGAIPNSPGIISAINQSVNLSVDEFRSLLSIPLNLPINNLKIFDELTVDAMVEKAKSYALANIPFVLPSNLSEDLQQKLVNEIPRRVTNADVRTVSVQPKFYMEFL